MKLKLIAAAIIGSVIAAAAIVPAALAEGNGAANGSPLQRHGRFQEGQTAPTAPTDGEGHFHGGRGGHKGDMHAGGIDIAETAATALGISVEDLRAQLTDGKSILDVATAAGKADAVKQAVADAMTTKINQAVADGKLSQEKADQALADLGAKVEKMLSFAGKGGHGPGGCEGKGGAPSQDGTDQSTTTKIRA